MYSASIVLVVLTLSWTTKAVNQRKNVLFFAIDDLRPELGCYGAKQALSPHIDALANKSILFERAYCQVAVCSPSRTSLLTGRRPDTNHVWLISAKEYWRLFTNATTIPQYFKENGYISIGMGKVFHPGAPNGYDDSKYSWSPEGLPYYHSPIENDYGPGNKTSLWWAFDGFEDNQLPDGQICDNALKVLQELRMNKTKGDNRPFFLAVGFHKPHVPQYAPKKYFDMYPPVDQILLPENPQIPTGMPDIAYETWSTPRMFNNTKIYFEGKNCTETPERAYSQQCQFPDMAAREFRRAYYAAMTYTDYQVGKVLAELEKQGFAEETIVVLWGDHGWQLGEHSEWAKFSNFEDATRVPFLLHVPGVTDAGIRSAALVELIDIFPSLVDLTGLPMPPLCPEGNQTLLTCVEGFSVTPLLKDPSGNLRNASFSQYARPASGFTHLPGLDPNEGPEQVMGYTIRTDQYRYTEWVYFNSTTATPHWDDPRGLMGVELYDHRQPTVNFNDENVNMAQDSSMKTIREEMQRALRAGWRAAK